MDDVLKIINKFIDKMNYKENEHVLGVYFYGSFLTGFNNKYSDIDLHVIFDDNNPLHIIRGITHIDGIRIEYFEKAIGDLYLTVENDYKNQSNAPLSILGTSKIIFDKDGSLKKLQEYTKKKFANPLPKLNNETAKEQVSILNNRMEKLRNAAADNSPYFYHLYHVSLEKIRKFYHKLNGMPEVQTTKIFRVYQDEDYRKSFYKDKIPEQEFIDMFINAATDTSDNKLALLKNIEDLYNYAKRNVELNEDDYRILIESHNK